MCTSVINCASNMLALCIFLFSIEYQCIVFKGEHAGCYLVIYIKYNIYSGTSSVHL